MTRWILLVPFLALAAPAQDDLRDEVRARLARLREKVAPAVVALKIERTKDPMGSGKKGGRQEHKDYYNRPRGWCTGTVIDPNGWILTSYFNAAPEIKSITVRNHAGKEAPGKVVGWSRRLDLALIKTDLTPLAALPHADLEKAAQGDFAAIVGRAPDPASPTINFGILSALHRQGDLCCQTDAELNYGNAGGPLVDMDGRILGVTSFIYPDRPWGQSGGVGFATRIDNILEVLEDLKKGLKEEPKKPPYLGITSGEPDEAHPGVVVDMVQPNSPAEDAGMEDGDIITEADGKAVKNINELRKIISEHEPGDEMTLKALRGGKGAGEFETKEFKVTLGEAPSQGE